MHFEKIRSYLLEEISDKQYYNLYNNEHWFVRIENNLNDLCQASKDDTLNKENLKLGAYLMQLIQIKEPHYILGIDSGQIAKHADNLQQITSLEHTKIANAIDLVKETFLNLPKNSSESKALNDAFLMELSCPFNGIKRINKIYDQIISKGEKISKIEWYDYTLNYLHQQGGLTEEFKAEINADINTLKKNLKKEKKLVESQKDLVLEKELNISEKELKALKKKLSNIKNRDDRGIQTLFRTTSRNHYSLKGLIDGKAKIMITINSIILSLIIGRIIGNDQASDMIKTLPFLIFAIINTFSILFAIMAITPIKTQGRFSESEIRNKQGNLLYFGNFHKMKYADFEWGFLQLLSDKDYMYLSLIKDFYYQGIHLHKKFMFIRISLYIFLAGIIITSLIYVYSAINAWSFTL